MDLKRKYYAANNRYNFHINRTIKWGGKSMQNEITNQNRPY